MKTSDRTFCLLAACALSFSALAAPALAADPPAAATEVSPERPEEESRLLDDAALDEPSVPVTPPAFLKAGTGRKPVPAMAEGAPILDRVTGVEKDPTGRWWTIRDAQVGRLHLLPGEWLEAVEAEQARTPEAAFRLSGEVYRYRGNYYLMLAKALLVTQPATEDAFPDTSETPPAAEDSPPTTQPAHAATPPADKPATADDVARELMRERPSKPIVPAGGTGTGAVAAASLPPAGEPIRPGPGRMVVSRLVRLLLPDRSHWFELAFEADNTLREPPLRALPNQQLEKFEDLSGGATVPGLRCYVSGEVHTYRGRSYILLRTVRRKREMGQF